MKQSEFLFLKMIANILNQMCLECKLSAKFYQMTEEQELFEDVSKVTRFRDSILNFKDFLDIAAEYAKIAEKG